MQYTIFHAILYRLHSHVKAMRTQEILINHEKEESEQKKNCIGIFRTCYQRIWPTMATARKEKCTQRTCKKETKNTNVVEYRHRNAVPNIVYVGAVHITVYNTQQHIIHFKYRSVRRTACKREIEPVSINSLVSFSCKIVHIFSSTSFEVFGCKMVLFAPKKHAHSMSARARSHIYNTVPRHEKSVEGICHAVVHLEIYVNRKKRVRTSSKVILFYVVGARTQRERESMWKRANGIQLTGNELI